MLAVRITLPHFSVSAAMCLAKSTGVMHQTAAWLGKPCLHSRIGEARIDLGAELVNTQLRSAHKARVGLPEEDLHFLGLNAPTVARWPGPSPGHRVLWWINASGLCSAPVHQRPEITLLRLRQWVRLPFRGGCRLTEIRRGHPDVVGRATGFEVRLSTMV
jgi:hypothetical protein